LIYLYRRTEIFYQALLITKPFSYLNQLFYSGKISMGAKSKRNSKNQGNANNSAGK
jgi:hypothetical protein